MSQFQSKSIVSRQELPEDIKLDSNLRPRDLNEFIGQTKLKTSLRIFIQAAQQRKEPLDHVLFYGAPGLGKTTLAYIVAREMGVNSRVTSGPALERIGDLAAILTSLEDGDILFIDEMHRINKSIEEVLYPAMEDYAIDLILGKGPGARNLRLDLPNFTLVGATTRPSLLSSPLRDRFGSVYHLHFYETEEIKQIVLRSAKIFKIKIKDDAAQEIAQRARFTPRVANRILKRVRDYAQVKGQGEITKELALGALEMLEIDQFGLNQMDRKILQTIIEKFEGGPVGIRTLSVSTGIELDSIEEIYEPYLIQLGFLKRTSRGRVATKKAYQHLGFQTGLV